MGTPRLSYGVYSKCMGSLSQGLGLQEPCHYHGVGVASFLWGVHGVLLKFRAWDL